MGISTGGNIGGQFAGNMANGLLTGANNEGHADSTTHAAVSDGTRGYRPPSPKDSPFATTGTQANFETYELGSSGKPVKVGNGHLNISD